MKSHRLLLAPAIAAALIAGAWSAPASATIVGNQLGTPDDGVVCRTGYTGTLTGVAFRCSRSLNVNVPLVCPTDKIKNPTFVERAGGQDVCERSGIVITSTSPLGKLTLGTDYVFAVPDQAKITTAVNNQIHDEAAALGLASGEVEGVAAPAVVKIDFSGSLDKSQTQLTLYTFAIKTGGVVSSPFPLVK